MKSLALGAVGIVAGISIACTPVRTDVPTAVPNSDFELALGSLVRIDETPLAIRFDTVSEDSRCPTDAQCVWEGNATLRLTVDSAGSMQPVQLRTAGTPQPAIVYGHRIEYRALRPAPTTKGPISPRSYIATLRVSR